MLINVTDLTAHEYCKRKLFLTKVLKLKEPLKPEMLIGGIRHSARALTVAAEEALVKCVTKESNISEIFREHYLNSLKNAISARTKELSTFTLDEGKVFSFLWPLLEEESLLRATKIASFVSSKNVFGEELWQLLVPKLLSEIRLESEALRLKGTVDLIEVYDEEYVPFELKTGSAPYSGLWPDHHLQLAAYIMLLKQSGKHVREGFVYYLNSKEKRQLLFNPFLEFEVKEKVSKVFELIETREIPMFCSNSNKCFSCGLREKCKNEAFLKELLNKDG